MTPPVAALLISALLLLPLSAFAKTPDPLSLLKRMQQSVRVLGYEGDFVYQFGDVLNAMHITHRWQDGSESEQLTTLTGVEREIVRNPQGRDVPASGDAGASKQRRLQAPTLMTFDPEHLDGIYDFKVLGSDRVAGRATTVVAILPSDDYRYGHRLYLDKETALPLRRVVLDKNGKPVSQQMFTSFAIMSEAGSPAASPADDSGKMADYRGGWQFIDLPKGYAMQVHTKGRTNSGSASEHFVFSDGIARISLFIEDQSTAKLGRRSSVGPVGILGSEVDGHRITIVGEAPLETLKHFLKSVHLQPEGE
ncbi:MAG: MucB/RseB C-terminal domain-containing protein [Pseudomonadota bacterium]